MNNPELHIVAGFLGAGKTTFLNSYLPTLPGITVVIENEAGTVGVDGALLPEGTNVRELSAGCICCTLAPQLKKQLEEINEEFVPQQIVIEPSGVGNLSDIADNCERFGFKPTLKIAMVDASEFEDFSEDFGTFYMDQIDNANLVLLTHQNEMAEEDISRVADKISESNPDAIVITSDWRELSDTELSNICMGAKDDERHVCECGRCHCHEEGHECKHHCSHDHEHEHAEEEHDHSYINNNFEQFMFENLKTWGNTTPREVTKALKSGDYGKVYRAKGFVKAEDGTIMYYDFVPNHQEIHKISNSVNVGQLRFIAIGKDINEQKIRELLCFS